MGNIKYHYRPRSLAVVKVYFLDQISGKAVVGGGRTGAVEDESLRVITFSNAFSDALLVRVMTYEKLRFKFRGSARSARMGESKIERN
jgi:hypothetical protein